MCTLEISTDFFDAFHEISSGKKKQIVRVGINRLRKIGTYITLKIYKNRNDEVFKMFFLGYVSVTPPRVV